MATIHQFCVEISEGQNKNLMKGTPLKSAKCKIDDRIENKIYILFC